MHTHRHLWCALHSGVFQVANNPKLSELVQLPPFLSVCDEGIQQASSDLLGVPEIIAWKALAWSMSCDVSKRSESPSLNQLQHWYMHRTAVYFHVGDMCFVGSVQYLPFCIAQVNKECISWFTSTGRVTMDGQQSLTNIYILKDDNACTSFNTWCCSGLHLRDTT